MVAEPLLLLLCLHHQTIDLKRLLNKRTGMDALCHRNDSNYTRYIKNILIGEIGTSEYQALQQCRAYFKNTRNWQTDRPSRCQSPAAMQGSFFLIIA